MHHVGHVDWDFSEPPAGYAGSAEGYASSCLIGSHTGAVHTDLSVSKLEPGGWTGLHLHSFESAVYVLAGTPVLNIDGHQNQLRAGDYALLPIGMPHGWANPADGRGQARLLVHGTPQRRPTSQRPADTFFLPADAAAADTAAPPAPPALPAPPSTVNSPVSRYLGHYALRRRYDEFAAAAGFELSGDLPGRGLRTADQQKVEILRALCRDARLIVMDEPTAALSRPDAQRLHQVIRRLAAGGTTVVLVSHFLREVAELADLVTILRDGRLVRTAPAADETEETMLSSMLGRSLGTTFPARRPVPPDAPVVLEARGLSAPGVHDVSLDVRAGEIVGLAGLVGSGRTELARALCQAQRVAAGTVTTAAGPLAGRPPGTRRRRARLRPAPGPWAALRAGLAMIPESRKEQGLMLGRPIAENVSLASLARLSQAGLVRRRAERQAVTSALGQVGVRVPAQCPRGGVWARRHRRPGQQGRPPGLAAPVSTLSGGNQQKALFARILLRGPRILVADEPTRGVDVGAKRAIYELLTSLAAEGLSVLLISSDAEEILGLAHRVLVMRAGRIAAEFGGEAITEAAILGAAFGTPEIGRERGA